MLTNFFKRSLFSVQAQSDLLAQMLIFNKEYI